MVVVRKGIRVEGGIGAILWKSCMVPMELQGVWKSYHVMKLQGRQYCIANVAQLSVSTRDQKT